MYKKNLIELENKELYEYDLKQGLFLILNIFTAFFISVLLGMVWQNSNIYFYFDKYIPLISSVNDRLYQTINRRIFLDTIAIKDCR